MYKVEIVPESIQDQAIQRRRRMEEERKKRFFNSKVRTMGVNINHIITFSYIINIIIFIFKFIIELWICIKRKMLYIYRNCNNEISFIYIIHEVFYFHYCNNIYLLIIFKWLNMHLYIHIDWYSKNWRTN